MIELKPFRRQDAKEIVKWIRDEEEVRLWSGNTFKVYPIQWKDLADHYENLSKDGTCIPMCAWDQDGIFGHFFLKYLDSERKHMRIGFIIVDDYCRGLGYGKAMVQKAMEYAFLELGIEDVTLGVFEQNKAAHQCYLTVGFEPNPERGIEEEPMGTKVWRRHELIMTR